MILLDTQTGLIYATSPEVGAVKLDLIKVVEKSIKEKEQKEEN